MDLFCLCSCPLYPYSATNKLHNPLKSVPAVSLKSPLEYMSRICECYLSAALLSILMMVHSARSRTLSE